MKVTLKEGHQIVYQKTTHQIEVEIDGVDYIVRQGEDDNGVDLYVLSDDLNDGNWINPYDMEDGELKEVLVKLANSAYDDFIFSSSNVGKEVDLDELEEY